MSDDTTTTTTTEAAPPTLAELEHRMHTGTSTPGDIVALYDELRLAGNPMRAAALRTGHPLAFRAADASGLRPMTDAQILDAIAQRKSAEHKAAADQRNAEIRAQMLGHAQRANPWAASGGVDASGATEAVGDAIAAGMRQGWDR